MKKFLCICFSSTLQRSITFDSVKLESVNRSKTYQLDASGKAVNSARILEQLEHNCVKTFCPLGKENSQEFISLAQRDNLQLEYVLIPGKTRECWTLLDSTAGTTTELVVGEPVFQINEDFLELQKSVKTQKIKELILEADAVLLAGSRPGIWDDNLYPQIVKMAVDSKKLILADFIGKDLTNTLAITTPSIIKINDEEFCSTFGLDYPPNEDALKTAIVTQSKKLNNLVIVTRGKKSTFGAHGGKFVECPTEIIKPVNTTACGDSFNAGFLHEYANSGNLEAALKKGTWCAARNAEKETPGTIR